MYKITAFRIQIELNLISSSSSLLLFVFLILGTPKTTSAQLNLTNEVVDTAPIELYLEMTDYIRKNGQLDTVLLKKYFDNPTVALFKQRPGFDALKFSNSLTAVYSKSNLPERDRDLDYNLMVKYRDNELIIRKGINRVKQANIAKKVKERLRSFYPSSFNLDSAELHFVYLFLEEGNGGIPGYVFNSALQTAYLGEKDIDVISAHEAYHSITNSIFLEKFSKLFNAQQSDALTNKQDLLWYLEVVAEEGIADLIDKKILRAGSSPLAREIEDLRRNEVSRSERRIAQIDSLLSDSNAALNVQTLNKFLEQGGHIPGRYMGEKIKEGNRFNEFVKYTGNPFYFFYLYNEAVKGIPSAPRFSTSSIARLKALETSISKL